MGKRFLASTWCALLLLGALKVACLTFGIPVEPFPGFVPDEIFHGSHEGFLFPLHGENKLAELREDEGHIIFRSEPDPSQTRRLNEDEREKQEKSWEMLRDIVIIPRSPHHPVKSPTSVPPSR